MNYERTISKFRIKTVITLLFSFLMFSSQVFAQTNGRQSNTSGFMFNENFWLIVIIVIASILIAKYFHQSGVITIYENYTDLAYTIGAPLIVWTVSSLIDKTVGNRHAINIFFIYLALHILWVFYASFRANNSDAKSVVVAILKIFLSVLSLLVAFFSFLAIFGSDNKKNETAVEYHKRMVGIALASTISAWVLSYIGKGLCRDKKWVSPSEYLMTKKSTPNFATPYLTIATVFCLLSAMGYLVFVTYTSQPSMTTTVIQSTKPIDNKPITQSNNDNGVIDIDTALTQFSEKFDELQPIEREQIVKQMNHSLPQTFSANGLDTQADSIVLNNDLIIVNVRTNASNSRIRIDNKAIDEYEILGCRQYYFTGGGSKNLAHDFVFSSEEGIVLFKLHFDYQKCSTQPILDKVLNLSKLIKFGELQSQLLSNFEQLSESERQQIITQLNQQLPLVLSDVETVTKMTLNANVFESESVAQNTNPELRATLANSFCPQYASGEISKSLVFSTVLKNTNGDLTQKVAISASDCK